MGYHHIPAMSREVIRFLNCRPGKIYVDGTIGGAGHAKAICENIMPDGLLIGIDQDIDAITNAQNALQAYSCGVHLFHGNFIRLSEFLGQLNIASVDGILLDLGVSLHQLEHSGRGFSFKKDEPLDMRMDIRSATTAEDLIHQLSENDLRKIFRDCGEERWSKQIARQIVKVRKQNTIRTSKQLAEIVCDAVPGGVSHGQRIHPATRVFMALRIAVNHELDRLETFLENAVDLLNPGGRLCVLSFHSLEDRIVKQRFKNLEKPCICPPELPICSCGQKSSVRLLTKKVVRPSVEEVKANPMARSTRLRAVEKI